MSRPHHFETLEVTVDGAIGRLTLNRPEKLNPLSATTLVEIIQAADWFDTQEAVKVVRRCRSRRF